MTTNASKRNIWFVSDHHFLHHNVLNFTTASGAKLRPFNSLDDMHDEIIEKHNAVVKPDDVVYMGGDVTWKTNRSAAALINALNGQKRLVIGNHDDVNFLIKTGAFHRFYLWKYFPEYDFIFSHVPLHERDLKRTKFNVHGHTHDLVINDRRYMNVCLEQTRFRPVHIDQVKRTLNLVN